MATAGLTRRVRGSARFVVDARFVVAADFGATRDAAVCAEARSTDAPERADGFVIAVEVFRATVFFFGDGTSAADVLADERDDFAAAFFAGSLRAAAFFTALLATTLLRGDFLATPFDAALEADARGAPFFTATLRAGAFFVATFLRAADVLGFFVAAFFFALFFTALERLTEDLGVRDAVGLMRYLLQGMSPASAPRGTGLAQPS